jgi:hypothetical protein
MDRAKQAFGDFIKRNDPNGIALSYRYAELTIEENGVIHKFATPELPIRGWEINSVFVDENVEFTDDQKAILMSRMR